MEKIFAILNLISLYKNNSATDETTYMKKILEDYKNESLISKKLLHNETFNKSLKRNKYNDLYNLIIHNIKDKNCI